MAFTLAGSLITQSGTDANLSGLTSVAGVTTKVIGAGAYIKTYYYLPNSVNLTYNNLSINPRSECLVFGTGVVLLYPSSSASVLNIGATITQNGASYSTQQEAIVFQDSSGYASDSTSGLRVLQGQLNWHGGLIRCQSAQGLGSINHNNNNASSALTGYIGPYAVFEVMAPPAIQPTESCQILFAGSASLVVDGLTIRGYGTSPASTLLTIATGQSYTTPPSFNLEGTAGLTYSAGVVTDVPVLTTTNPTTRTGTFFTIYGFKSKAGVKGLNLWLGSLIRGINLSVGSAIPIVEHNIVANQSQGYVEVRNEARFTCKTSSGTAIQNAVLYMRDTNNGSRKLYNLCQQNINNTADKIYIASTNASGIAEFLGNSNSILLCAVAHLVATYSGVNNSGQNLKDLRSKTNIEGTDDFTFYTWAYSYLPVTSNVVLKSDKVPFEQAQTLVADSAVTLSESSAAALTLISTLNDLYDAAKYWKTRAVQAQLEYPLISSQLVTANGTVASLSSLNIVIDATAATAFAVNTGTNTITIKSSTLAATTKFDTLSTSGTISFANGANATCTLSGIVLRGTTGVWGPSLANATVRFTAAGSYDLRTATITGTLTLTNTSGGAVTVRLAPGLTIVNSGPNITVDQSVDGTGSITNIVSGSRIQIYNVTTATELVNAIVSGTSYTYSYTVGTQISSGNTIRVRLTYQSGVTAKARFESLAVAGATGFSVLAQQTDDEVYNLIGIDGSTATEFSADYPNVEVNVSDPDNSTSVSRMYAWWVSNEFTADGIRQFFGGIDADDAANFKIVTSRASIKIDNTSSTGVTFTGDIRLYRDDGATPLVASTTGGGSITLYAGKVYTVETGTSGLTPTESAKLMSIPDATSNANAVWSKVLP